MTDAECAIHTKNARASKNLCVLVPVVRSLFILLYRRPSKRPAQPQPRAALDSFHHAPRTLAHPFLSLSIFLPDHSQCHTHMRDLRAPNLTDAWRVLALGPFDPITHTTGVAVLAQGSTLGWERRSRSQSRRLPRERRLPSSIARAEFL